MADTRSGLPLYVHATAALTVGLIGVAVYVSVRDQPRPLPTRTPVPHPIATPDATPGVAVPRAAHSVDAAVTSVSADAAVVAHADASTSSSRCPADMVLVEGEYCPLVEQRCLEWTTDSRLRCLRFQNPSRCLAPRRHMSFCIDRYEWPNRQGESPSVMVTWIEAQAMCREQGRRLCTQDEWTFACEGEEMVPYGYGFDRTPDTCTVDHFARAPNRELLSHSTREAAYAEARGVYEASPSGTMPRCVSPFGVHDMPGNVDEWTVNESGYPFQSALKGGWWGRIRGRCRPATLAHYEHFRYYQIGFRCCDEDPAHPSATQATQTATPSRQTRSSSH